MVRVQIVNSSELSVSAENPTGCWSALRYTGGCLDCDTFKKALSKSTSSEQVTTLLKCKPKLSTVDEENMTNFFVAKDEYARAREKFYENQSMVTSAAGVGHSRQADGEK